jgi:hypothetical protein
LICHTLYQNVYNVGDADKPERKKMAQTVQYQIECFYDRSIRLWTCLWLDAEGNQHGCAQYAVRRAEKDQLVALMKTSEPSDYQI